MEQQIFILSDQLKDLRDQKKDLEQFLKDLNGRITEVETELIEKMVESEISSFKRNGQGFSLVMVSFPQAETDKKDELYAELKKRGFEHLFTINHQTLTSTLKEMISQNEDTIPDWLEGLVKTYEKASIRIYKG